MEVVVVVLVVVEVEVVVVVVGRPPARRRVRSSSSRLLPHLPRLQLPPVQSVSTASASFPGRPPDYMTIYRTQANVHQIVSDGFRLFHIVSDCFRPFQIVRSACFCLPKLD